MLGNFGNGAVNLLDVRTGCEVERSVCLRELLVYNFLGNGARGDVGGAISSGYQLLGQWHTGYKWSIDARWLRGQ